MLNDIKVMRNLIIGWVIVIFIFFFFFFAFPLDNSFSSLIFKRMEADLVPEGVSLIVLNPWSAFFANVLVAFGLSLITSFPFILYTFLWYILPALRIKERREFFKFLFPAILLFIGGCVFAYKALIPPMFKILYGYAPGIGAETFFSVDEFINFTFIILFVVGFVFLLPIFMVFLSKFGLIEAKTWREEWRWALLIFLFLSALITPDGSGVSMVILSVPLFGLYMSGAFFARRAEKKP